MTETTATTAQVNMSNLRGGIEYASQWTLMWYRFKKHRLALISAIVVLLVYLVTMFAEFFAPTNPEGQADDVASEMRTADFAAHPPQMLHLWDNGSFRPHVILAKQDRDPETLELKFVPFKKVNVGFFVRGYKYKLLGIESDLHFFGPTNPHDRMYLLGADESGRDLLTRILYGGRFTMALGLFGVFLSMVLGIVFGGISGYYGGKIDWAIQRMVEFIISLPTIPIWMGMAAALPKNWPPHIQYFAITVIISLIGWTSLARVVRGRFLAMRTEVFVVAAKLDGCGEGRVIFRHMLPSLASHIIAAVTLAIPNMIIAETSLSFLGLGLQPPAMSWGVLLQSAQKINVLDSMPWLLLPGAAVVISVLALNFMGDGLRDAADPYAH
ncbi:MAG: ABC transporter permease [Rhodocyclaceae bacterium]